LLRKRILVAIETDATRFHGEHPARPRLPGKTGAEQMLSHLSTDLAAQFPDIKACALCMAGALYDQTELLRPGYPVFTALEELLDASFQGQPFQPRLLSVGAEAGLLPNSELQPSERVPLGILLLLPVLVACEADRLEPLAEAMEHRFIESGQLSAHSARALEAQFGIAVNHARFMTMADLSTLLHMQLDHFGFLPLWQLLDAAVSQAVETLEVQGRGGQHFRWNGCAVETRFETFDEWASKGQGRAQPAADQLLAASYADWTREYRQYLTTLQAHGIAVEQETGGGVERSDDGSFAVETTAAARGKDAAQVTEHSAGELGTVAVTVMRDGQQHNFYPLEPGGLNRMHARIRETMGGAHSVSFPGCILYDAAGRRLRPDSLRGER